MSGWYHGGYPGLGAGDWISPPDVTGTEYLREVLTPEALALALDPYYGPVYEYRENGAITVRATGAGLHRRIFGEDK